jgi:hypothetical protein
MTRSQPLAGSTLAGVLLGLLLYALHQDLWFWRAARPLAFGFLPVGLAYHAAYCVACALLLRWLVSRAWPQALEDEAEAAARRVPDRS